MANGTFPYHISYLQLHYKFFSNQQTLVWKKCQNQDVNIIIEKEM